MNVAPESGTLYRAFRAIKPLRMLVRWGRGLLGCYRVPAWHIEGRERASGQPLALFYAGHLESKNHIVHLALEEGYVECSAGMAWLWSAWRRGIAGGADLVVTRQERRYSQLFGSRRGFNVPCWVGLEAELAQAEARCAKSESVRTDVRRIGRHKLGYEVTRDQARFKWFYDTMYLPYILHVHGDRAMPTPWSELERSLPQCELLFVQKDGDRIAGSVQCDLGDGRARVWMIGLKDGDPAYARMGAQAATYHFVIQHLAESGFRCLHFGATRAFLHDGVLRFKKKYGPRIVGCDGWVFHVRIARLSAGVSGFLMNNPFITDEAGAYYGNFFVDETGAMDKEKISREIGRNYVPGIAAQRVYTLRDVMTQSSGGTWPPVPMLVEPASSFPDGAN